MENKLSSLLKQLRYEGKPPTEEAINLAEKLEKSESHLMEELFPTPEKCRHRWSEGSGHSYYCGECGMGF